MQQTWKSDENRYAQDRAERDPRASRSRRFSSDIPLAIRPQRRRDECAIAVICCGPECPLILPPPRGERPRQCFGVADGERKAHVARELGVSRETVYQYLRAPA